MTIEKIIDLISNLAIPEYPQTKSPEEEIERRGYQKARFEYAEAKLRLLKELKLD